MSRARAVVDATTSALGRQALPFDRLPDPIGKAAVSVDGLWTLDGLPPRRDNLAVIVKEVRDPQELLRWRERLRSWPSKVGVLAFGNDWQVYKRDGTGKLLAQKVAPGDLREPLARVRSDLFSPAALAQQRGGQLSFADLGLPFSPDSLAYLSRHRVQVSNALTAAIQGSFQALGIDLSALDERNQRSPRRRDPLPLEILAGHAVRVAVAFFAARILQDKGFVGGLALAADDPVTTLLRSTAVKTNGFFKQTVLQSLPRVEGNARALAALETFLGQAMSFVLVDDSDVGDVYENALHVMPHHLAGVTEFSDLQQHYTPVALCRRILEHLPLERLAPEERYVFDPAAGSGSFLLAATERLARMSDVPQGAAQEEYLHGHVIGSDIDPNAALVAHLRYRLIRESYGHAVTFPEPSLSRDDYNSVTKATLASRGVRPRVVVANPPYQERGKEQVAASFVTRALEWMEPGAQFGFILPDAFLLGSSQGFDAARAELARTCDVLDVWQLPERSVGRRAQQAVCAVVGVKRPPRRSAVVARAIYARAESRFVRSDGYLGVTWLATLSPEAADWREAVAPRAVISVPTIALGDVFAVCTGLTPQGKFPPQRDEPGLDGEWRRRWKMSWRGTGRLWADVRQHPWWFPYDRTHLAGLRQNFQWLLDAPKLMVGRSVNRDSRDLLPAVFDADGLYPDNDAFCVGLRPQASVVPQGWKGLKREDRLYWLLGLLASDLVGELSLSRRNVRKLLQGGLEGLPLPARVDREVIECVRGVIERDRHAVLIDDEEGWREELNELVEASYGHPERLRITRGSSPSEAKVPAEVLARQSEEGKRSVLVLGQVLASEAGPGSEVGVRIRLDGLRDGSLEGWIEVPRELPGWTLDGAPFEATLSDDVTTVQELTHRPWALRQFRHSPRAYLSTDEITDGLLSLFQREPT